MPQMMESGRPESGTRQSGPQRFLRACEKLYLGRFGCWWKELPESKRASCIVTHHHCAQQTGLQSSRRLMSLVFHDPEDMSKLLRVSLAGAVLLVDLTPTKAGTRKLSLSVVELEPQVWAQWCKSDQRRRSKSSASGSTKAGSTKAYIVKPGCKVHPSQSKPKLVVVAETVDDILTQLWRRDFREGEHHRKAIQKWLFRSRPLLQNDAHLEDAPALEVTSRSCEASTEELMPVDRDLELRVRFFFLSQQHTSSTAAHHGEHGFREEFGIWPSLLLHLVFDNGTKALSSISASLHARFTVENSNSRWGHDKLTLSCACSSSPSAVSVREQQASGLSGTSFQLRKRGLNSQVKFVAESNDASLGYQHQSMAVNATWDVLFHSPTAQFDYEFSVSQKLRSPAGDNHLPLHGWTRTVSTYHHMGPWYDGLATMANR